MAKDSATFSRLILSILLLAGTSCVFAQWSGSGPRWNYNGRETMYVGPLQTTGSEGFSFAFNWRFFPGAIEIWPRTFFKSYIEVANSIAVDDSVDIARSTNGGGIVTIRNQFTKDTAIRLTTNNNNGSGIIGVFDEFGNPTAGIIGESGEIIGESKAFLVPHPNHEDLMIRYTSLEGPTPTIYIQGSVVLTAGRATVEFPEHFAALADLEKITINLTPWSANSLGVAVDYSDENGFQIAELHQGSGEYRVDYVVHALRVGYEDYDVYLAKNKEVSPTKSAPMVFYGPQGEKIEVKHSIRDYYDFPGD